MQSRPWHHSYPEGMPLDAPIEPGLTLPQLLQRSFDRYPEHIAFTCMGASLSYGELERLSSAFAAYWQQAGMKQGDRVALMLPNSLVYAVALAGALRAGLVCNASAAVPHLPAQRGLAAVFARGTNRLMANPRDIGALLTEFRRAPFSILIGVNTLFNGLLASGGTAGRARRAVRQGTAGLLRLLGASGGKRQGFYRRRLVSHRRHCHHGQQRFSLRR